MQREARIYALYAVISFGIAMYAAWVANEAWNRFGPSGTFATYVFVSLLFVAFTMLGAFLAFSFTARAVAGLSPVPGGFELRPHRNSPGPAIRVEHLRHLRTIGKQFAADESAPAFTFFRAAGRIWVIEAGIYRTTAGGATR